ncbi:MAG: hypothetical protein ACRDI2_21520, partial [Chloroflexota bacterium]
MTLAGRLVILLWAIGMAWVGMLLVMGQGNVAMAALGAGRLAEAAMQLTFVTVVLLGTTAAVLLFLFA